MAWKTLLPLRSGPRPSEASANEGPRWNRSQSESSMIRKFALATVVALLALTSSISIEVAEAHGRGWHGGWGWAPGGGYYNPWGPRYYGYGYIPYVGPRCYVNVYGTTTCY